MLLEVEFAPVRRIVPGGLMRDKAEPVPSREARRLLNVREAAKYLGTTDKTLYTKIWRREIPFIKIGRSVRFDIRDLEALIETSKVRPKEFPIDPYQIGGKQ